MKGNENLGLAKILLASHNFFSNYRTIEIIKTINDDEHKVSELMVCFFSDDKRLAQRAAHITSKIFDKTPTLIQPYLSEMIELLEKKTLGNTIKRNILRILQFVEVDEKNEGRVANVCFNSLENPKEAIAIRVFAMTVLHNISKKHVDLQPELKQIIESILEKNNCSPALISRGSKIIAKN